MELDETIDSAASWRALAQSVPDQVFRLDRTGRILFVNRVVAPLTLDQVIGTNWLEWVPIDQRERLDRELAAVLAEGHARSYELEAIGPDHTRAIYASQLGAIVEGGEVVGVVLSARDVTQQRQLENQLVTSDRLAAMGTLAAGIAHEINNPLACVTVNLAVLDERVRDADPEVRQIVAEAREAATRVQHVLRDLSAFARDEEPSTPCDLVDVLEATLRLCASETRYRARVVTRFEALPSVAASASYLGEVFLNVVVHAARGIPSGSPDAHELRVTARRHDARFAAVEIADSAEGIGRDRSAPLATNLGLVIAHRIVSTIGGDLRVHGTTFTILLPFASPELVAEPAPPPAPVACVARGRVLLIDDEPLLARAVARVLGEDHDITIADRADEVLRWLDAGQRFDAIVCDLMMPHMTGMEFHAALEARDAAEAARVIFLSGGAFTPAARDFLARIPNTSFAKPFDLDQLAAAVDARVATATRGR